MAEKNNSKYPLRMNGYIYSKGTQAGFLRMQRMGIPRPLFRVQDKLAKILKTQYANLIRELLRDVKREIKNNGMTVDSAPIDEDAEEENLEDLIEFFTQKGEELKKESEEIAKRMNMGAVENSLEHQWIEEMDKAAMSKTAEKQIAGLLKKEQDDYMGRLLKDAGPKLNKVISSFTLDKDAIFQRNLDNIRVLYLNNTLDRVKWEQDLIKRRMLKRINDYVTGQSARLEFDDLTKMAYETGDNLARLFARDQMQRFNKALTLSTFTDAGVTKVKWVTCHDARVRKRSYVDKHGVFHRAHTELDGQIFGIKDLPPEIDDYNCRCGLVPVEWEDE